MANEKSGTTLASVARVMPVRDRSLPDSGGVLTGNRGCPDGCVTESSQDPHVPQDRNFTEVAITEGDQESCTAASVDSGGSVRELSLKSHRGDAVVRLGNCGTVGLMTGAAKDMGKSGNGVHPGAAAHVQSHPQLMNAHRNGSYSKDDHKNIHSAEKCVADASSSASTIGSPSSQGSTMPAVTQKAEFSPTPVVATPKGQWMRSRD